MRVWVVRLENGTELVEPLIFSTAQKACKWIMEELHGDSDFTPEERDWGMEELCNSFLKSEDNFGIEFFAYCESRILDEYENTHFNT